MASERVTHKCPADSCSVQVPSNQYACRSHWYSLPKPMRDAIWQAYRYGTVDSHLRAMHEAGAFLNGTAAAR